MKAYWPDSATPVQHGKKVAVVGGGNVAMDAAWLRPPSGRGSHHRLPPGTGGRAAARKEEVEHAKKRRHPVPLPDQSAGDSGGRSGLGAEHPLSGNGAGRAGRFRPPPSCAGGGQRDGAAHGLRHYGAGHLPQSAHQVHHRGSGNQKWGGIVADADTGLTPRPGVYAGGDAVSGAATVILTMGAGKTAASAIDRQLMG